MSARTVDRYASASRLVRNVVGADTNFASMRYLAWYRPDGNFRTLPHDARDPMAPPERGCFEGRRASSRQATRGAPGGVALVSLVVRGLASVPLAMPRGTDRWRWRCPQVDASQTAGGIR